MVRVNRVSWNPEIEVEQYSIAYEIFSITFKIPYYKKESATSCENTKIWNFQILFKLRKKIHFSIILFYDTLLFARIKLSFIVIIAYHVFCDANPRKCNSELIV